jgi:HEAT repeat protein
LVLFRVDAGRTVRIRTLAPDCDIDAGGVPLHWLNDVKPPESVALLNRFAAGPERMSGSAIGALALHADASAEAALESLVAPERPEWLRLKAIHWFNNLDLVISLARNDRNPRVRRQALFWLGQKAGQIAIGVITGAIDNDPERDVKRRAVAALRQLPDGEGIPLLIQLARANRDPDVRKQAMAMLGQTRDPRALAFFEDALKGKL